MIASMRDLKLPALKIADNSMERKTAINIFVVILDETKN